MESLSQVIKVDDTNMTVSARDLHDALEVTTPFRIWFPRMTEYGFSEGSDFNPNKNVRVQAEGNREVSREVTDYSISIDMAKEICMIQRTEKGREVRKYFLDLEKAWNTPEQIMARALRMADKTIASLQDQVKQISAQNEEMKPKALFADAVATADTSILIGDLAKLIRQNGYDIGQNRLFGWLRDNGYLVKHGDAYNMPTQKSMDLGLFEVKERTIGNPDGSTRITRTTKVTGKGQQYFINKFLGGAKCSAT
jgi:anti-repressor protein